MGSCSVDLAMVGGGHAVLLGLGPRAQVEAACDDPSCPSCHLCHPRLHPTACPTGIHAGQDERRHSAPPPQPRTQAACSGRPGEGEEKSALVSGGRRSVPGREPVPACSAGQTEGSKGWGAVPSQLAWATLRGASTGPRSRTWRRGAGRPGGHEGGLLLAKVFSLCLF